MVRLPDAAPESTVGEEALGLPLVPVRATGAPSLEALQLDVSRALHRFGFPATLSIEDEEVIVRSPRGVVRRSVPKWASALDRLPPSEREALVRPFARSIAEEARASLPPSGREVRGSFPIGLLGKSAVAIGLAVAGAYWLFRSGGPSTDAESKPVEALRADSSSPTPPSTTNLCRREAEALRGGARFDSVALGEFEPELFLLSSSPGEPLDASPPFLEVFSRTAVGFDWRDRTLLENLPTEVRSERLLWSGPPNVGRALRLTFARRAAPRLLSPATNGGFLERLGTLSERLELSAAALYGRCDGTSEPCFVSWIYGVDEPTAEAAWLYFVGATGSAPLVASPFLHPPSERETKPAFAFSKILERTRSGAAAALWSSKPDLFELTKNSLGVVLAAKGTPRDVRLATRQRLIDLGLARKAD